MRARGGWVSRAAAKVKEWSGQGLGGGETQIQVPGTKLQVEGSPRSAGCGGELSGEAPGSSGGEGTGPGRRGEEGGSPAFLCFGFSVSKPEIKMEPDRV